MSARSSLKATSEVWILLETLVYYSLNDLCRNAILGRPSTAAEEELLSANPGDNFGQTSTKK